jgi:hypothetical protein
MGPTLFYLHRMHVSRVCHGWLGRRETVAATTPAGSKQQAASSKQQCRSTSPQQPHLALSFLHSFFLPYFLSFFLSFSLSLSPPLSTHLSPLPLPLPVSARLPALLPTLQSSLALQCSGRMLEHNSKRPLPDSFYPRMPQSGPAPATSPTASMVLTLRSFRGTITQWRVRRGRFKWSASFSRRVPLHGKRCHATKQSLLQQTRSIPYIYRLTVRAGQLLKQPLYVCMYVCIDSSRFPAICGPPRACTAPAVYTTRSSDRGRLVEDGSRMDHGWDTVTYNVQVSRGFW